MPHGYVCVRVDSRGAGCSPGFIDHFSPRETQDFYDCIEWAGAQPWSNGKVGLNGISYYGMNQWQVAALQPPHLAAICVWEGAADWYRDMTHHGGILCTFWANWYDMQVKTVQHGARRARRRNPHHRRAGVRCRDALATRSWPRTGATSATTVRRTRSTTSYHRERSPDWAKITVPLLSAANWGGQGLHLRGNVEGFVRAGVEAEVARGARHRALDPLLHRLRRGAADALLRPLPARARTTAGTSSRACCCRSGTSTSTSSSAPRTNGRWRAPSGRSSTSTPPATRALGAESAGREQSIAYDADRRRRHVPHRRRSSRTPRSPGRAARSCFVSSTTEDADLFLVLRVFARTARRSSSRARSTRTRPSAQGWLRASHRKLDPELTLPYRPYHTHDEVQPLTPGAGRTSSTSRSGRPASSSRTATASASRSAARTTSTAAPSGAAVEHEERLTGCGPFLHDDPHDRPPRSSTHR